MVEVVYFLDLKGLFEIFFYQEGYVIIFDFGGYLMAGLVFSSLLYVFEFLVQFFFSPVEVIE